MNDDRDIERVLEYWLVDGVDTMPDRVFVAALDRVDRQPQALERRLLRRLRTRMDIVRLVAAVAAVVVVALVGNVVLPTRSGVGVSAPTASPSQTPNPAPTSPASPSVGVTGACDLITEAEAGAALRTSSAITAQSLVYDDTAAVTPLPSPICWFHTGDSTSLFLLVYNRDNAAETFAIWKRSTGMVPVPGLGDDAVWDPLQTTLYVLKADRLVTIEPVDRPDPTLTLEVTKAIGAIVARRM